MTDDLNQRDRGESPGAGVPRPDGGDAAAVFARAFRRRPDVAGARPVLSVNFRAPVGISAARRSPLPVAPPPPGRPPVPPNDSARTVPSAVQPPDPGFRPAEQPGTFSEVGGPEIGGMSAHAGYSADASPDSNGFDEGWRSDDASGVTFEHGHGEPITASLLDITVRDRPDAARPPAAATADHAPRKREIRFDGTDEPFGPPEDDAPVEDAAPADDESVADAAEAEDAREFRERGGDRQLPEAAGQAVRKREIRFDGTDAPLAPPDDDLPLEDIAPGDSVRAEDAAAESDAPADDSSPEDKVVDDPDVPGREDAGAAPTSDDLPDSEPADESGDEAPRPPDDVEIARQLGIRFRDDVVGPDTAAAGLSHDERRLARELGIRFRDDDEAPADGDAGADEISEAARRLGIAFRDDESVPVRRKRSLTGYVVMLFAIFAAIGALVLFILYGEPLIAAMFG